jgi:hypothetical protein
MVSFRWQVGGCGCDCKDFCETDALSELPCVIGRGLNKSDVVSAINAWGNKYSNLSAYVLYPSCDEDVLGCIVAINNSSDVVYQNVYNQSLAVSDQQPVIKTITVTKNTVAGQLDSIAPINPSGYIVYLCSEGTRRNLSGVLRFSDTNGINDVSDSRVSVQFANITCTKNVKEDLNEDDRFWTNPCTVSLDFNIGAAITFSFKYLSPSFCYRYTVTGSLRYEYSKVSYYVFKSPNPGFATLYPPGVSKNVMYCTYTSPSSRLTVSANVTVTTSVMKPTKVGCIFYFQESEARRYFYAKVGAQYYKLWVMTLQDVISGTGNIGNSCSIDSGDISEVPSYTNASISVQSAVEATYNGLSSWRYTTTIGATLIGDQTRFNEYSASNPVDTVYTYETYDAFANEVANEIEFLISEVDAKSFVSTNISAEYRLPCSLLYTIESRSAGTTPKIYPECMEK